MDIKMNIEKLEYVEESCRNPFLSASSPNESNESSPFMMADEYCNTSPNCIQDVFNDRLITTTLEINDVKTSKRGPGRPRKDMQVSVIRAPSSSESSNIGFPDDKYLQTSDELPYAIEKYPNKLCCLCNLGERSSLGQGDFLRFAMRDDFSIEDLCFEEDMLLKEDSKMLSSQILYKRQKSGLRGKLTSIQDYTYELESVGHPENVSLQTILDGCFIYVHRMCAMWSLGKTAQSTENNLFELGDVVRKSTIKRCSYCGQFGASVNCKMDCLQIFHFPCAVASGCLLVFENVSALCTLHLNQAPIVFTGISIDCRQCSQLGDISKLIICSRCGDYHHTNCIGLADSPGTRTGWTCARCSKCQICKHAESTDTRLLKCEQCQKVFHTGCLRPVLSSIPKYGWKCYRCRVCTDCGSRTPGSGSSSRWHCHYTICDSCYQQRNKGFSCPICHKAYRAAAHKEMVKCNSCNRFVHSCCDEDADLIVYHRKKETNPDYDYFCPYCKINNSKKQLQSNDSNAALGIAASEEPMPSTHKTANFQSIESAKPFSLCRNNKKRASAKELLRSRGGKLLQQKNNLMNQFAKKRGIRGGNHRYYILNNNVFNEFVDSTNNQAMDEFSAEKQIVLFSAKDKFVLSNDVCVMCGSIGIEKDNSLICCAQCGQCYHVYCANIRVSKIILEKGWRCLDCTVCEGCGKKNDEAKLILCDDCDVSFHIYCMNPPLDTVPNGCWKCNSCAVCQKCGRNSPGKNSSWSSEFVECGPCASQSSCSACDKWYTEGELIIQCANCELWLHAACDDIKSEDDMRMFEYNCQICRTSDKYVCNYLLKPQKTTKDIATNQPPAINVFADAAGHTDGDKVHVDLEAQKHNHNEITHWLDGVCITDKGFSMVKSLTADIKKKRRLRVVNEVQSKDNAIMEAIESVVAASSVNKMEKGSDISSPQDPNINCSEEADPLMRKKRHRNLQKLGIGGFNVRNRNPNRGLDGNCLTKTVVERHFTTDPKNKKKIGRKKLKGKLANLYPAYLQEAFFGKALMDIKEDVPYLYESETSEDVTSIFSFSGSEQNTSNLLRGNVKIDESNHAADLQIREIQPNLVTNILNNNM